MLGRNRFCLVLLLLAQNSYGFTGRGVIYPGRSDVFELSIIHINDFHARFEQTSVSSGTCRKGEEDNCIGGIARVVTASRQLLQERPNPLFVNAGDHYQGTLWYNVHKWNVTSTFFNMLDYDVMTIGNHDFDDGVEGLVPLLQTLKAPVVLGNIDISEEPTLEGLYENSTIIEKGGKKIGVIGVILSKTNEISSTGKTKFLDEVTSVNEEAAKLKKQGIDIIIVLSHCGLNIDRIMARDCPDIDVIVGGHSHTFLFSGEPPATDQPEDEYPVVVVQENTKRTVLVVQAAAFTKYLGNLTVWFDEKGEVEDWEGNPIYLDYSIEQDPDVLAALEPWKADVDAVGGSVVGKTKVELSRDCKVKQCNLANFITDAMVDSYLTYAENDMDHWTYAAIAVQNSGGIRTNIQQILENITYSDAMMVLPFQNTWDTVELQGKDILHTIEESVVSESVGYSKYLLWSGLRITYNMTKPDYSKVVDVKVRCQACLIPKYEPLDLEKWYRIVVSSFLGNAGDGYDVFRKKGRNYKENYRNEMSLFTNYMRKMSPIVAGIDFRVIFLS